MYSNHCFLWVACVLESWRNSHCPNSNRYKAKIEALGVADSFLVRRSWLVEYDLSIQTWSGRLPRVLPRVLLSTSSWSLQRWRLSDQMGQMWIGRIFAQFVLFSSPGINGFWSQKTCTVHVIKDWWIDALMDARTWSCCCFQFLHLHQPWACGRLWV